MAVPTTQLLQYSRKGYCDAISKEFIVCQYLVEPNILFNFPPKRSVFKQFA